MDSAREREEGHRHGEAEAEELRVLLQTEVAQRQDTHLHVHLLFQDAAFSKVVLFKEEAGFGKGAAEESR